MFRFLAIFGIAGVCWAQQKSYAGPKTPHGDPDLQGVWTNVTITPLERPAQFATKPFLTSEEARKYEKETVETNNADRRDLPAEQDVGKAYNDFWWDRGTRVVPTLRTSLVIDPPDGRVPALTRTDSAARRNGWLCAVSRARPMARRAAPFRSAASSGRRWARP